MSDPTPALAKKLFAVYQKTDKSDRVLTDGREISMLKWDELSHEHQERWIQVAAAATIHLLGDK